MKVSVLGLWHLGLVSLASLADMGHQVIGFDSNDRLMAGLRKGELPIFEPGLDGLIETHSKTGRLQYVTEYQGAVADSDVVLITHDTPVDDQDQVDLSIVDRMFEAVLPYFKSTALVIVNSQVPVGSTEQWQARAREVRPHDEIDMVYSPENLRLGQAVELFKKPDMIVIGTGSDRTRRKAHEFFESFEAEKFYVSWRTAEMAKHALNVFFATSISFANELGNLCDAVGADGFQIAQILRKDARIGKKAQVRPGLGFAGGTLARDLRALENLGRKTGVATRLVESVLTINQRQKERVVEIVEGYFKGDLRGKALSVFGLTYKSDTSTLRRSASLEIIELLHEKGTAIRAHDPKADLRELMGEPHFEFCQDPYDCSKDSSGILLLTEWALYKELDYARIKSKMRNPFLLDAKNFLDGRTLEGLGFHYVGLGRGQIQTSPLSL